MAHRNSAKSVVHVGPTLASDVTVCCLDRHHHTQDTSLLSVISLHSNGYWLDGKAMSMDSGGSVATA